MANTQYGLTAQGYVIKRQAQIMAEITASLQGTFGANINLSSASVFGQFVGIFAEREALLWELGQAIYASQYPAGAEGTSVDNILALNNLVRLPASPTKTDPAPLVQPNLITLYGLVLGGVPGTLIPSGSLILTQATPPISFTVDNSVVNAVQTIFFSNIPNTGSFGLTLEDADDNSIATALIPFNALASPSQLQFNAVPSTGAFTLSLTQLGLTQTTASIPYTAVAADVQTAIQALTGFSSATVTGDFTSGFVITWGATCNPLVTVASNSLGVTIAETDSVQAVINQIQDPVTMLYPFTDVVVTGSYSLGFTISFGAGTVVMPNPNTANQPIALTLLTTGSNTLEMTTTVTNVNIVNTAIGTPAQAIATATATVDGPNFVGAGTINVIGTPITGWTSVNNQLDCITGTNVESDTDALTRRATLLAAQANGPLQAIVEKVREVAGVTQAIGFENITSAAVQILTFSLVPDSGNFQLAILTSTSTTETTGNIAFNAGAPGVQSAIQALSGYSLVLVTGTFESGLQINFNGATGGQPQNLFTVPTNTLEMGSTPVTVTPSFGRPGHSFEIVVQGGTDTDIATVIYGTKPAGIQAYGNTVVNVTDIFGNPYPIGFSRPTPVDFFVSIVMVTDLSSPNPQFIPGSVSDIQQDIVNIGNAVAIGGLIVGFGSNGLIGAFNSVPGIISYTLFFGRSANPSTNTNIQLAVEEVPDFQIFNVQVSYS